MSSYNRSKLHIRPFIPLKQLYEEAGMTWTTSSSSKEPSTTCDKKDESNKEESFFGYAKSMASTVTNIVSLVKKHYDSSDMTLAELLIGIKYYHVQKTHRKFEEYLAKSIDFDALREGSSSSHYPSFDAAYLSLSRIQHHAFVIQTVSPKVSEDQFYELTSVMFSWEFQDSKVVDGKQSATLLHFFPVSTKERNGYALFLNHHTQELCLYINGTQSLSDIFIDLNITPVKFMKGFAHEGMAVSSKWFEQHLRDTIEQSLREYTNYRFLIIGHSLGAGVAALLGLLLKPQYPSLKVLGFSAPKCVSSVLLSQCQSFVETFIYMDDVVPLMSLSSTRDLRRRVARTNWKHWVYNDVDSSRPTKWLKGYSSKFSSWWHKFGAETCYERTEEQLNEESLDKSHSIPSNQILYNPGFMYYIRVIKDHHYLCVDQDLISSHLATLEFNGSYIRHHYCDSYYMGLSCLCSQLKSPKSASVSLDHMLVADGLPLDHDSDDSLHLSASDDSDVDDLYVSSSSSS